MKRKILLFILIAAGLIIGCLGNLEKYPKEKCAALPGDNVVKAIHDNCISCHKTDFTTKQDICVRKNMIIDAVKSGRMPKIGTLYESYKTTILNWK
jgi:hypothetical protein